jgi:hypothetical protein
METLLQISEVTPDDVSYVASRMRDSDYREFFALSYAETRYQLVEDLVRRYGHNDAVITAKHDGEPIAIGGTHQVRPNVITLSFFATNKLPQIGLSLTRFITKNLMPRLESAGVHRFECVSIEGHDEAHRWIETLGLKPETGRLLGYGKAQETFIQFSKVRNG